MTIEILDKLRIATPSIRGYYYQFLWTAIGWVGLAPGEVLYCEGSEDIDKVLPGGDMKLEQIKSLKGTLTETDDDVKSVLLNFAKEYVFNLRRGVKARIVFRTTARLGNAKKDPLLGSWLEGGSVDLAKLDKKITEFAKHEKDRSGHIAVRYMRKYELLDDFARSFVWIWGECDHGEIRSRLAEHLRRDARCEGLQPESLADAMIARIAWISSSDRDRLDERRLDSLDLEVLINDQLVAKQIPIFAAVPRSPLQLHVAHVEAGGAAVVVAGRFGSEEQVQQLFATLERHLADHPESIAPEAMLSSRDGREMMSGVDVDLFVTFGVVPGVRRRTVRYRWLAQRAIKQALAGATVAGVTLEEDWQQREIAVWLARRNIFPSRVRTANDPVAMYVAKVAKTIAWREQSEGVGEWTSLNRMISRKLRFVLSWDTNDIFTQEHPFV